MNEPKKPQPSASEDPWAVDLDHRVHGLRDGLQGMRDLMDRLLGEQGCAWDREQTLDSLRPYLLEETYEVLESMDDAHAHKKELGDLLFQIVFHAALREREGSFDLEDVIAGIRTKMLRRHPHVFGHSKNKPTADEVTKQWAALKQKERDAEALERGETREPGAPQEPVVPNPLAGVPVAMPALQRAWRLQDKAASVGFDWPDLEGPRAKVEEEWAELQAAIKSGDTAAIADELGDLLFVLVRLGQKLGVESEGALRGTIGKFERRFAFVMKRCVEQGIDPAAAGLERLDGYWSEAKAAHRAQASGPSEG